MRLRKLCEAEKKLLRDFRPICLIGQKKNWTKQSYTLTQAGSKHVFTGFRIFRVELRPVKSTFFKKPTDHQRKSKE